MSTKTIKEQEDIMKKIKRRKKRVTIAKILFIILMMIAGYLTLRIDTEQHEKVHQLIFEDFGINSTIELNGLEGMTRAYIPMNMSQEDLRFMNLAHEMNEIEAYNNSSTKILLVILIIVTVSIGLRDSA